MMYRIKFNAVDDHVLARTIAVGDQSKPRINEFNGDVTIREVVDTGTAMERRSRRFKQDNKTLMRKISITGVLIGGVTDVLASIILGVPLVVYVMVRFDLLHKPTGSAQATSAIHAHPGLYGVQLFLGLGCSVLGGYIAARIAKHEELLNGLLSSYLCTGIGLYSALAGKNSQSMLVQIFLFAAAPLFALLGGYLRQMQIQKRIVVRPE